jgi:hypothetical protein
MRDIHQIAYFIENGVWLRRYDLSVCPGYVAVAILVIEKRQGINHQAAGTCGSSSNACHSSANDSSRGHPEITRQHEIRSNSVLAAIVEPNLKH